MKKQNNYIVAEITTPDGIFFTARNDDREHKEVVAHGQQGFKSGQTSPLYESLNKHEVCSVNNLALNLSKEKASQLKKAYIIVSRSKGLNVLNAKK